MSTPFDDFSELSLADARALVDGADALLERALERARALTGNGKRIDEHQVTTERVAYAATEGRAARALVEQAARDRRRGPLGARPRAAGRGRHGGSRRAARRADRRGAGRARPRRGGPRRRLPRRAAREAAPRGRRGAAARPRPPPAGAPRPERPAPRRDPRADPRVGARVRRAGGRAPRRAHPPQGRPRARGVHPQDGRARLLRPLGARGVRRPRDGQPRDGPHHRGALARVPRGGGLADHAARDPHQGAAPGRHRRAEAQLAAAHRLGRDHGRHLGDGAGRRERRRGGEVPRRARDGRREGRLRHQRAEGVVHLRGPRRRARAPRAHRPGSELRARAASRSSSCRRTPSRGTTSR